MITIKIPKIKSDKNEEATRDMGRNSRVIRIPIWAYEILENTAVETGLSFRQIIEIFLKEVSKNVNIDIVDLNAVNGGESE